MPDGNAVNLDLREDPRPVVGGWGRRLAATMREWRRRHRSRAALAAFDDRMLADIGITRADAWREIIKPFWRP